MATENDKVNTGALATLVLVGLFATLSIALAVTALVRYSVDGVSSERQSLAQQGYRDLKEEQSAKLGAAPAWTDKAQGLLSIPIDRAKQRVLGDLARDPSSATPAPPPAASGEAASAEGAPGAVLGANAAGSAAPEAAPAPAAQPAPARTVAVAKPPTPAAAPTAPPAPAPAPVPAPAKPTDG